MNYSALLSTTAYWSLVNSKSLHSYRLKGIWNLDYSSLWTNC